MQTLKTDNPEVALASYEVPNAHPPLPVMKIKKAAKLRAGQSADSSILATLPVGSEVQIKESTNGWNHVYFDGHDGFLPDSVLKDTGRSVSASPTKKTPDVTKLVNSIKATKAANEGASKELDTAADNVRTLLG